MSMPSEADGRGGVWHGTYSGAETAGAARAELRFEPRGLVIDGLANGQEAEVWPFASLHTDTPVQAATGEAILSSDEAPGATLYVDDVAFVRALCRYAPHITTTSHRLRWARPVLFSAALIVIAGALAWFADLKPARAIAHLLPQSARVSFGDKVVRYVAGKHQKCVAPAGRLALTRMFERLMPDTAARAGFSVVAVDWGLVNAFAAPGGRIVITRGLIQQARSAEEVAGVLAHEIGHGLELHPEAGIFRALGISAVLDIMMGGSSGTLGGITGLLLQSRYARDDERAADHQALTLLRNASISQQGLADFFERISRKKVASGKAETKPQDGASGSAFDLLRSHPQPGERAAYVRATKRYASRPVLRASEWADLRSICSARTPAASN